MTAGKTAAQVLADIKGYAAAGRVTVSGHAVGRVDERGGLWGTTTRDLRHALKNATAIRPSRDGGGRWLVDGKDLDGDDLTLCCVIENGVVVITIF